MSISVSLYTILDFIFNVFIIFIIRISENEANVKSPKINDFIHANLNIV